MRLKIMLLLGLIISLIPNEAAPQQSDAGRLHINSDNPHYFTYKGRPLVFITQANSLYPESLGFYEGMAQNGLNHKTFIAMTNTGRPSNPYKNENINDGWNEESWQTIRNNVRWANENDIIIGVMLWSSAMIESMPGRRWDTHLWNECNGGPIPSSRCLDGDGKDEFYTLDRYKSEITGPYNVDWSWQKKNQFRQEELVKKYLNELKDFPNVYYIPMFEIGDHWGSSIRKIRQWYEHIAWLIKKYQPKRLTAEVIGNEQETFVAEWDNVDFLLFEGPSLAHIGANKEIRDAFWSYDIPLAWQFLYTPSSLNPDIDDDQPEEKIRNAVIYGLHPSTKFGDGNKQVNYASALAKFLETVDNWCDEPGQEITGDTAPKYPRDLGVDLPAGSGCNDSSLGDDKIDNKAPLPPQNIKVNSNN